MRNSPLLPGLFALLASATMVLDAAPVDLRQGLIAYWPLDESPDSLTTPDLSPFGNHLELVNMDAGNFVPGHRGNAAQFNGTDEILRKIYTAGPDIGLPVSPTSRFTVAFWVTAVGATQGGTGAGDRRIFSEGSTTSGTPIFDIGTDSAAVATRTNVLDIFIRNDGNTAVVNHRKSAGMPLDGTWHHVAWVQNDTVARVYIDGVADPIDFSYGAAALTLNTVSLGGLQRAATGSFFAGLLDDVALWERPLSTSEVQDLIYNGLTTPIPKYPPLVIVDPIGGSISLGDNYRLSVVAVGNSPLLYQWLKNDVEIPGAVTNNFTILNATAANAGTYTVRVSNLEGAVTSATTVTVQPDPPAQLDSGLVSFWPLDTVDESTGTTPDLYSGNPMSRTFLSLADLVPGNTGLSNALHFESGLSQYAQRVGGFPVYDSLTHSVSLWVRGNGASQLDARVFSEGSSTINNPLFTLGTMPTPGGTGLRVLIRNDAGTTLLAQISTRPVFNDAWHHVVWVDSNGTARVYIDGVQDPADFRYTRSQLTVNLTSLGAVLRAAAGNYFTGDIDEVAVWNRALSFTEVNQIFTTRVSFEQSPQTISFQTPPRMIVGANSIVLEVSSSSGLPVTLTSSDTNIALVTGKTVIPRSAGTATITASQPGNNIFFAATDLARTVYVDCLLQRSSSASGSISANPDVATYPANSVVLLTANATPGYGFIRWEGALTGSENPVGLIMDTNKSVSAVFASLAVTATAQGEGIVLKEPDFSHYVLGQQVTLRAQPNRWRKFQAWTDGQVENPRTITVGEHNSYTAVFVPETPLETVTIGGVNRVAPVGMPALLVNGTFVTATNIPVRGPAVISMLSTFFNARLLYTLNGSEPGFTSALYSGPFVLPRSATLRAVAYNVDFTVVAQSDPLCVEVLPQLTAGTAGGGTVTVDPPAGDYFGDGTARVTANAAPGWTFLQWLGDATGPNPVASISMNHARCVQAVFGTSISDAVVGGGTVVRNAVSQLYPFGETVRLTAVPQTGNYFAFWANAATGTNNPLSIGITTAQPTVTAVFAPLPAGSHAIAVIPEGYGRVDHRPRGNYFGSGTNVVLTAVPEAGQAFLGWTGDAAGTNNPLVVAMTQSQTIVARFTKRPRLTILDCDGVVNIEELQMVVTGEYGASYLIEASQAPGDSSWVERIALTTPFGFAEFIEPIPRDGKQYIYRAVGE